MNKMELIDTLRFEAELTKTEAAAVVDLFLMKWPMRLLTVTGLKSGDCVLFMSKNTRRMPVGTRKQGNRLR